MKSKSSPDKRSIDVEIKVYCDDKYLLPDCARYCVPRDNAFGHYTCDYVRGLVVCHPHWYGDLCTQYCRSRNDAFGNYTCDKNGVKICARNWYGGNCSTFCKSTDDMTGHFKCDPLTGDKVCLPDWHGGDCLILCKAQDNVADHYLCNSTSGEKVCLGDWYELTALNIVLHEMIDCWVTSLVTSLETESACLDGMVPIVPKVSGILILICSV